MKTRITISLPVEVAEALKRASEATHVPISALVAGLAMRHLPAFVARVTEGGGSFENHEERV